MISKELEIALGESTFAQIVQDARARRRLLPRNHPSVRAVERIGRRLAAVASDSGGGGYSEHMQGLEWEFVVVDDPGNVNAMVAPGKRRRRRKRKKKKKEFSFFSFVRSFLLCLFSSFLCFLPRSLPSLLSLSCLLPPSFLSLSLPLTFSNE